MKTSLKNASLRLLECLHGERSITAWRAVKRCTAHTTSDPEAGCRSARSLCGKWMTHAFGVPVVLFLLQTESYGASLRDTES